MTPGTIVRSYYGIFGVVTDELNDEYVWVKFDGDILSVPAKIKNLTIMGSS